MKILVTGAPGWLGTRLVEILREQGKEVRALALPYLNEQELISLNAEVFKGDLQNADSLRGVCDGVGAVFHCAGLIHPKRIKQLYDVNVIGTKNILNEAIKSGVKKIVYVSSNSVGGVNKKRDVLMKEDDLPNPYKHYGKSKHEAEKLVNAAFEQGKINTTILRPCWFYGVRQPERQTTFFRMIKKGNPIVFGDGQNLRSMTYIDNLIEAMLLAEQKEISAGKTYWIADRRSYPTIEIYETIAKLLEVKNWKPRFVPAFVSSMCEIADDVLQAISLYIKEIHVAGEMDKDIACSIEKARTELNYNPTVDLEEGMRRSIAWCRANGVEI
ncbi:NAD(P)-dependent oxidoreductase [bacterium]|nr:NAD(P)-dependent oxidoreductase [bacterium]